MRSSMEARLKQLEAELESGQKMVAEIEAKRKDLTSTLLRIDGAITVLRELLAQGEAHERESEPLTGDR